MARSYAFNSFCFSGFLVRNLLHSEFICLGRSLDTAAVPFGTMVAVMALWFGVSVPLTFFGAFLGFRRSVYEYPVRTRTSRAKSPPQQWYMNKWLVTLIVACYLSGLYRVIFILTSILARSILLCIRLFARCCDCSSQLARR